MTIFELKGLSYKYKGGKKTVLEDVSRGFERGKLYAIVGDSGAGKTTLLSLLAGLDEPTEGQVLFDGEDIKKKGYAHHRKHNIALVFQSYNLIDYLTPLENMRLVNKKADEKLLLDLGLTDEEINRNVLKLSGGQQQRAAIGRALAADAPVILADEPTGNLDGKNTKEIMKILLSLAHDSGKCVIIVTHSKQVAKDADVVLELKNKGFKE